MYNTSLKQALVAVIALLGAGIVVAPANAQLTAFAFVNPRGNPGSTNFRYDRTANQFFSTAPNGTSFASTAVNFSFDQDTEYATAGTNIPATLSFISTGAASVTGTDLLLSNITMSITANTPGSLGSNLLTILASSGRINGTNGSSTVSVGGSVSGGNTVNFSSNYLDFSSTTDRAFTITTSGANPAYGITGGLPNSFNGRYNGNFSSDPVPNSVPPVVVPEAGAGLLAGLVLPIIGGIAMRRRYAK